MTATQRIFMSSTISFQIIKWLGEIFLWSYHTVHRIIKGGEFCISIRM